ncbi:hypothetical protein [Citrobacter amalonaticus]|uniref:hypothetical protein n=1 Tax=Citrobacter amalonaticus TaxID=35703 RepID=UPI00300C5486
MSIGIIGTKCITRTGFSKGKFIPFIYVLVEDSLAKEVIELMFPRDSVNKPKSAIKCIISGVWQNQAACMYGFYTYGNELISSYRIPFFSILAVADGDICEENQNKRLDKVIKGDSLNKDQVEIKEKIRSHTTQFKLEYREGPGTNNEKIKALPEYNHKKWFDEITEQMILDQHQNVLDGPDKLNKMEIDTLLEVIAYSKSILTDQSVEKIDYHCYYNRLKAFAPKYPCPRMNHIEYYVLSAIRQYNPVKWECYIAPVRDRIMALAEENHERFKSSHFDLR